MVTYTDAEKKEILDAIAAKGCGIEKAYRLVKEEREAAGRSVPSINSVYNWRRAAAEAPAEEEPAAEAPAEAFGPDGGVVLQGGDAEYTRNLELVVRLYRTRSEKSIDAVCDRLLPDLVDWENEQ